VSLVGSEDGWFLEGTHKKPAGSNKLTGFMVANPNQHKSLQWTFVVFKVRNAPLGMMCGGI
jgi:hypothetical protein